MRRTDVINLNCPSCGREVRVKTTFAGKRIRCPNEDCGKALRVPDESGEAPVAAPSRGGWIWLILGPALPIALGIGLGYGVWVWRGGSNDRTAELDAKVKAAQEMLAKAKPEPEPEPPPPPHLAPLPHEIAALLDTPADLVAPIPQDPEKQAQRQKETLAHNEKTLRGAYDRVGRTDPRWDAAAQRALDLAARHFSGVDPLVAPKEVHEAANEAVEAGCDDPLMLYLHARFSETADSLSRAEADRRHTKAALALKDSKYPPFRKMTALARAAVVRAGLLSVTPEARKEAGAFADDALELLAASAKEDERGRDLDGHWHNACESALQVHRLLTGDYKEAFDRVDNVLQKTPELEALREKVKGDFYIKYAWEARGSGLAKGVGQDAWAKFHERLPQARAALERAWELQPDDAFTATRMLTVELGMTTGRETMELWFERAMKADNNNKQACWTKMEWLHPKWHGNFVELVAFGKACQATKNWRGGITLLAPMPYYHVARSLPPAQQKKALALPKFREMVTQVYDEYLKHRPDDSAARTEYAILHYATGYWRDSDVHFEQLGDRLTPPGWATREWVNQIRTTVAQTRPAAQKKQRPMAEGK
jgi:tetratricopeptide (TPR) repeat protein